VQGLDNGLEPDPAARRSEPAIGKVEDEEPPGLGFGFFPQPARSPRAQDTP
jgi:hypothetical protein